VADEVADVVFVSPTQLSNDVPFPSVDDSKMHAPG
jgi:hypothetical protein